jgi:histidinol-phosphate aminotransferase
MLLDANENSYGSAVGIHWNCIATRLPPTTSSGKNCRIPQVDFENIFLGVGSDEPIDLLMRIFCEPGKDAIIITPPTYGMYKVAATSTMWQ